MAVKRVLWMPAGGLLEYVEEGSNGIYARIGNTGKLW